MPSIGGVWYTAPGKIRIVIHGKEYTAKLVDKKGDKSPDWRGDNVTCWERKTKKGDRMFSILVDGINYTALLNQWKDKPEKADMNVLEPLVFKDGYE